MKKNIYDNTYFFVDESGDTVFYDKYGNWTVGKENGSSPILLMGSIKTSEPQFLREEMLKLHRRICRDKYLKGIPSMEKTKIAFHAKDDCQEVRYEVFKLLRRLPFSCKIILVRKNEKLFNKFEGNTQQIYDNLITDLFKNTLHLSNNNYIYIATRGSKKRQVPLENAIQKSIDYSKESLKTTIDSHQIILPQTPSGEPCLQIVDYCNWAIQRAYTHSEMRYYDFLSNKFSLIIDSNDYKKGWKNFYNKKNPFDIKKISPLRLGIKVFTQHVADFRT